MWQLTIQYKHKILVKICASSTDIQGYLRRAFPLRRKLRLVGRRRGRIVPARAAGDADISHL